MKQRIFAAMLAAMLVLTLGACTNNESEPQLEPSQTTLQLTDTELPRIDGATALVPYYEAMTAKLLGVDIEKARTMVLCTTTSGAYQNLVDHNVDMIFCLDPSDEQVKAAENAGFTYEINPITCDAFVFFVNANNPVDSITLDQLKAIYKGEITNWSELGGEDLAIMPYQRSEGSGSQTGLYKYVVSADEAMTPPTELVAGEMSTIVDAVANYDNAAGAIGYSYYYYVANMYGSEQLKLLRINDIEPSTENISTSTYPMISRGNIIIRSDEPEGSTARRIVEWARSPEGAALATEAGYIPCAINE